MESAEYALKIVNFSRKCLELVLHIQRGQMMEQFGQSREKWIQEPTVLASTAAGSPIESYSICFQRPCLTIKFIDNKKRLRGYSRQWSRITNQHRNHILRWGANKMAVRIWAMTMDQMMLIMNKCSKGLRQVAEVKVPNLINWPSTFHHKSQKVRKSTSAKPSSIEQNNRRSRKSRRIGTNQLMKTNFTEQSNRDTCSQRLQSRQNPWGINRCHSIKPRLRPRSLTVLNLLREILIYQIENKPSHRNLKLRSKMNLATRSRVQRKKIKGFNLLFRKQNRKVEKFRCKVIKVSYPTR